MHPNPTRFFHMRLENTPSIRSLPPFLKEKHIRIFIEENADRLRAMFATPHWLPGVPWDEIERELVRLSRKAADGFVAATYANAARSLPYLPGGEREDITGLDEEARNKLASLATGIFDRTGSRGLFAGDFNAVAFDTWSRYVDKSYAERGYLYGEITGTEGLALDAERIKTIVKAALMLRPYLLYSHLARTEGNETTLAEPTPELREAMLAHLPSIAPFVPDIVARSCVESSFAHGNRGEAALATGRFVRIAAFRSRFVLAGDSPDAYEKPGKAVRGAESADASWYSVARGEEAGLGLDTAMVEELYRFAAVEGW